MKLLRILFVFIFSLCLLKSSAQQMSTINIDALTDQQLMQFISQAQLSGLSEVELEAKARERGLSADQIAKLKIRLQNLSPTGANQSNTNSKQQDMYTERSKIKTRVKLDKIKDTTGKLEIYGADIFDNEDLSFEPNLTIATPRNYVIGVGDEMIIDLFGFSESTKKIKVTSEGFIRFPNLGPINIVGLTIEDAEKKIKSALTKIYPDLAKGNTSLKLSVGQIRAIRVTLLGEIKRPGSYNLSSLSTVMNALYASGGPNEIGSFRNIELVRAGKTVVTFDLYDFLLKGDLTKNLLLRDEDVIKVGPYKTRVGLKGAVKKPAIFELKNTESAFDVLQYAGGFADIAYKENIRVKRFGQENREIVTVKSTNLPQFKLVSGDTLVIDSLTKVFANRITIKGAVYYPGEYGLTQFKSLKDLLDAVKPKEEAYLERGIIRRYKSDYTSEFVDFNLSDIQSGKSQQTLLRDDSIHIYSLKDIKEKYTITITGQVNKPGIYDYSENMKVKDLVLMAEGFKEGASLKTIEVSRRINNKNSKSERDTSIYAIINIIDLDNKTGNDFNRVDLNLEPFDIISVRKSPSYKEQITVTIEGEVLYPGQYVVSDNSERLSDLVKRAGGLKSEASPEGALLVRNTFQGRTETDSVLFNNKFSVLKTQSQAAQQKSPEQNDNLKNSDTLSSKKIFSSLNDLQKPVGIRLEQALKSPNSVYDLFLLQGDVLKVPRKIQTVQSFGAVYIQKQIVYREGLTLKDIIRESGGYTVDAARKGTYLVYANGEVRSSRNFFFFTTYPKIKPGTEVYVPYRSFNKKLSSTEIIGIGSALASIAGIVVAIVNATK